MPYKNILLQLSNYPVRTPDNVIGAGLDLAAQLGGQVTAAICTVDLPNASNNLSMILTDIAAVITSARQDCEAGVREIEQALATASRGDAKRIETITLPCYADIQSSCIMGHARLSDLVMVPVSAYHAAQALAHDVIFGSGRPVLLLPAEVPSTPSLDTVVVAWDGSRVAARAVSDAMPFLQLARHVRLVEIAGDKPIDAAFGVAALRDRLVAHDVETVAEIVDAEAIQAGEVLAAYCTRQNADMLVIGAYGHSRVRDFVLGGVTKHFVANTTFPVLLSH